MRVTGDDTLSFCEDEGDDEAARRASPTLFLALRCDRPLEDGVRIALRGLAQVELGRANERTVAPDDAHPGTRLRIGLADPRTSSQHARLVHRDGAWFAEDLGSKNGTFVDGQPAGQAPLTDGAVIEVGSTLFLFRTQRGDGFGSARVTPAAALHPPLPDLATFAPALRADVERLAQVSRSLVPVLLRGESGTGKEVMARAIHQLSGRDGAFTAVNCGAIAPNLVEAELFGYRKGAFSGATEDRLGLIRTAHGGTLFLDEIGDLPLPSQAALLRVLQEREVLPIGATSPVSVDLRVVCATHRELAALVTAKRFREDLLSRLSGFTLRLPALRDRREDLALIVPALLRRVTRTPERVSFTRKAARLLLTHDWPQNIRELERCLEAATILAGDRAIDVGDLPEPVRESKKEASPVESPADSDRPSREELVALLEEHQGNVAAVARAVGKAPAQIHRWIKRHDVSLADIRRRDVDDDD